MFEPHDDSFVTEPALTIDMYSSLTEEHNALIEPLFLLQAFLPFLDEFKQLDIAKIILMCAAAHAQLPNGFIGPKDHLAEVSLDFPVKLTENNTKLAEVTLDLNHCSKEQYLQLHHIAQHYDLTGDKKSFVPILINHVFISTLSECRLGRRKHGFFAEASPEAAETIEHPITTAIRR